MYLNVYHSQAAVPGRVGRLRASDIWGYRSPRQRRWPKITDAVLRGSASIRPGQRGIPWVDFVKGQRKDDVMHEHLRHGSPAARGCCSLAGCKRRPRYSAPRNAARRRSTYPWIVKTTGMVNHFYFYCVDDDFGPFFIEVRLLLPVHREVAASTATTGRSAKPPRRVSASIRVGQRFRCCGRPAGCSGSATARSRSDRRAFAQVVGRSCRIRSPRQTGTRATATTCRSCRLSSPYTDARQPVSGRVFFEKVIRDNLDIGRPDQVALIFHRR